ncbi:histidine kinase [Promicromonospora sp. MEB111]|uniref:sensor histidine kinase n=1 Tax=Promicromonospora sp. MEB111 TaxID=3040301 RepID=UPI00254FAE88|nr:histidine kinase [Promicromonospora sp. MEB111]
MNPAPAAPHSTPARVMWGAALGAVTWPADLFCAVLALVTAGRPAPPGPVRAVVAWHRRRAVRFFDWSDDGAPLTSWRASAYLALRVGMSSLSLLVLGLLAYGVFGVVVSLASWLFDVRLTVDAAVQGDGLSTWDVIVLVPIGAILLYLDLMGLFGVGLLDRWTAARWLSPSRSERLAAQVEELTVSRADLLSALDAERGRIERDLHDGVQQRAVALGLLVNRARRLAGPGSAGSLLLEQAGREAEQLVTDLRDVAWRVRPTTLDTHGLEPVLRQLVSHTAVPTALDWAVPVRLPAAVETTVYYVVAEALTNVARHSGAAGARVAVRLADDTNPEADIMRVVISDDGGGGAAPRPGHGLAGLAGRAAAAGGALTIESPVGGPTRIEVTLPCA